MEKPTVKISHYEVCLTPFPNSQSQEDLSQQRMRLLAVMCGWTTMRKYSVQCCERQSCVQVLALLYVNSCVVLIR